jgi:hypothetical protein
MSDALDLRTAILPLPFNVRFWGECVAKLFPALRSRNNRILLDSAANQHCVFSSDVESIISPTRPQSASSIERDFRTHNTRNVCSLGALLLRSRGAPTPSLGLEWRPLSLQAERAMSAIGTKRTFRGQPSMSAYEGKADIDETCGNVR